VCGQEDDEPALAPPTPFPSLNLRHLIVVRDEDTYVLELRPSDTPSKRNLATCLQKPPCPLFLYSILRGKTRQKYFPYRNALIA